MTRASILLSLTVVIVVGCGGTTGERSIATSEPRRQSAVNRIPRPPPRPCPPRRRSIDVIGSDLPGYAPVHVETLEVLGTTGQLGEIEDGLKLAFALPCGTYTLLAYGVSAADFKRVIASLKFD